MHQNKNIVALCLMLFMSCSLSAHAQQKSAPADLTPNTSVNGTPEVCMMYHFGTKPTDPLWPASNNNLVEASDGTIYGAASNGGCAGCHGMVFKMTPKGEFTITHVFDGIDGDGPSGGLTKGKGDVFYGVTYTGGKVEFSYLGKPYTKYTRTGTIFSVSAGSTGISPVWSFRNNWLRRVGKGDEPHSEKEKQDAPASYPVSPPVTNKSGQTMGVTTYAWNQRYGALYSLNGEYATVENMGGDKALKLVSLSPGVTDNNFYGVSTFGAKPLKKGALFGTVFMSNGGPLKVLHTFNGADGASPSNVIQGKDGKLYGTTYWGGMYKRRHGVIYRMNTDGTGYEILHQFNSADGANPLAALVWGNDNRLYGSTRYGGTGMGVLFRIDPDGKNYTVLHSFVMWRTGKAPMGNMILHSDGNFYGTTSLGGKHNGGGIFRLDVGLSKTRQLINIIPRICCSLGQGDTRPRIGWRTGGAIFPNEVVGHHAGVGKDNVGYVYTQRAGLIDIGHVRDMIDWVKYVYDGLMLTPRGQLPVFNMPEGEVKILKELPSDQEEILKIAGAVAYVNGWAHELTSYGDLTPGMDWSSFSPEDLVSNVVGAMVAQRAIRNHCGIDFNRAVDLEMIEMMKELKVQPKTKTQDVLDSVDRDNYFWNMEGKWFTMVIALETLLRRNFEVMPWLVPWEYPYYRPAWLNDVQYKMYYPYFQFTIFRPVNGKPGVTLDKMQEATDEIRKKWVATNPGMDKWPRPAPKKDDPPDVPGWPEGK